MSDQSTLWGSALEVWDKRGVVLMVAGAGLGLAALAATVASSFILWKVAGLAQSDLEKETRTHTKELGEQKLAVSNANARSDEANAKALEAQLALEKFKAVRFLSVEQMQRVAEKIKPFAGTAFDMSIGQGDFDAQWLLGHIEEAMTHADWVQRDWKFLQPGQLKYQRPDSKLVGIVSAMGIIIEVHPSKILQFGGAAKALADALDKEGLRALASFEAIAPDTANNPNAIHVIIGIKPP